MEDLRKKKGDLKKTTNLMKIGTTSSFLNPSSVKYLNEIVFGGKAAKNHELNKQITLDHY